MKKKKNGNRLEDNLRLNQELKIINKTLRMSDGKCQRARRDERGGISSE